MESLTESLTVTQPAKTPGAVSPASKTPQASSPQIAEQLQGPAWDNSTEYPSMTSPEFQADRAQVEASLLKVQTLVAELKPAMSLLTSETAVVAMNLPANSDLIEKLQTLAAIEDDLYTLLGNLSVFVSCEAGVDGKNQQAQKLTNELQATYSRVSQAFTPVSLFFARAPEAVIQAYLQSDATKDRQFHISLTRKYRDTLLSEAEENLISSLSISGHTAWGTLYNQISGQMKCRLKYDDGREETLGFAQTSGLVRGDDEKARKAAWHAINYAWKEQKESAAGILNALAGWRIELAKKRSTKVKQDFLSQPIRMAKIERETLDAMMLAVREFLPQSQAGLRFMANGLGKKQLDPWDILAGAPAPIGETSKTRSFNEGLEMIRASFMEVDREFGEFCDIMLKNNWMEGRVLESKRNGAYCTGFPKSRTPRVFQTYMGSMNDIRTLAHELGHAYHSWVQRDLPRAAMGSPMTLAETASVFAETAFADYVKKHGDAHAKNEIRWQNAETAASFLINIPVRYEFEKALYTERQTTTLTAEELSQLMSKTWMQWYGDTLSGPDEMFWASKLHFAMSYVSFYNFPYTFGYLFSLSLYAKRKEEGADFMPTYRALLRDTGRMTAEELVQKHTGEDIGNVDYWRKALKLAVEV
ncbi:MAG: M3 family oligoendopeptidase [Deltaproteobacteria bacterium]|nr:M3 family oligoendopeptidase [Deltaproteobacteria bacterium]